MQHLLSNTARTTSSVDETHSRLQTPLSIFVTRTTSLNCIIMMQATLSHTFRLILHAFCLLGFEMHLSYIVFYCILA